MSTDRELLEMAARAIGLDYHIDHCDGCPKIIANGDVWNPFVFDGQALRLAVKRHYTVKIARHEIEVWSEDDECLISNSMQEHEDYEAATRRSIVEAAAEEGRRMP